VWDLKRAPKFEKYYKSIKIYEREYKISCFSGQQEKEILFQQRRRRKKKDLVKWFVLERGDTQLNREKEEVKNSLLEK